MKLPRSIISSPPAVVCRVSGFHAGVPAGPVFLPMAVAAAADFCYRSGCRRSRNHLGSICRDGFSLISLFICNYFLTQALRHRSRPPGSRSGASSGIKKGCGGRMEMVLRGGPWASKGPGLLGRRLKRAEGWSRQPLRQPVPSRPRIIEQIVDLVNQQL